jgi:coenzyme Q-binding protein COQ10
MAAAQKTIVIDAPLEKVYGVISSYDQYPQFLSEVKELKTANRQGNQVEVQYKVEVMKTIRYTLRMKEEPPRKVSWTFVEGDFMKDNQGSWVLEPEGEGKTRVTYSIEMKLGSLVPQSIVKALVETSLPKMLDAFKKRAEGR